MKINEIITEDDRVDEVQELTHVSVSKGKWRSSEPSTEKEVILEFNGKLVGKTSSGHKIYKSWSNDFFNYYAINPANNLVDLMLEATKKNNVLSDLRLRAINKNNTLKAHSFYHFLITKLNLVLVANSQSPGGHAVWKQLQRFHPDVNIHGWYKGKSININMDDPEYTHGPRFLSRYAPEEILQASKMELVAHKK